MQSASILTIGSEILDGRVQDTNANFVAASLSEHGITVASILSCPDIQTEIISALAYAAQHSDFIIVSGGLGPTSDDLTRDAVAAFIKQELILNETTLAELQLSYRRRNRHFDALNRRQAFFPQHAKIINNPVGTAAGFCSSTKDQKQIVCLPGVPAEMRAMFDEQVLPLLLSSFKAARKLQSRALRILGLPESTIGEKIESCKLPAEIEVSYRAGFPEVQVLLKSHGTVTALDDAASIVTKAVGQDFVFSSDLKIDFNAALHQLLLQKQTSLSVAESCTAGLMGSMLAKCPGCSRYFLGGAITYSNAMKQELLGVKEQSLRDHGAVSHAVAKEMAAGARQRFKSDLALSITGIAGPDGGTTEKPVGTFFVGLASPDQSYSWHYFFSSSRDRIRSYAAYTALDNMRRFLLGHPFREEFKPLA